MKKQKKQNYKKYKDSYRKSFIEEFLKQIDQGESFTIFGMPGTGKNDLFKNFAENKKFWESVFPNKKCNFLIIYIDLQKLIDVSPLGFYRLFTSTIKKTTNENINNQKIKDRINDIYNKTIKSKEIFSVFESCEEMIKYITDNTKLKLCILIYDIAILSSFDKQFFNSLKALRNISMWKIILSFASDSNILQIMGPDLLGDLYSLIQNKTIWLNLASKKDSILIMEEWERENGYRIPQKVKNKIFLIANGHPGFMRSLNNIYQEKKKISILNNIKKISKHPSIIAREDKFWNKLNEEYKNILIKYKNNPKAPINPQYLYKTGILKKKNGLFSKLLEYYLDKKVTKSEKQKKTSGIYIDTKTKTTFIDNKKLKQELTENEFKILLYLYKSRGNIVSKDEIAEILWKNKGIEKYSDWAIDKTISRLRKKFGDSARNPRFIETIKGRGLRLLN